MCKTLGFLAVTKFSTTSQFCKKRRRTGRKGESEVRDSGIRVSLRAWREREREREREKAGGAFRSLETELGQEGGRKRDVPMEEVPILRGEEGDSGGGAEGESGVQHKWAWPDRCGCRRWYASCTGSWSQTELQFPSSHCERPLYPAAQGMYDVISFSLPPLLL